MSMFVARKLAFFYFFLFSLSLFFFHLRFFSLTTPTPSFRMELLKTVPIENIKLVKTYNNQ